MYEVEMLSLLVRYNWFPVQPEAVIVYNVCVTLCVECYAGWHSRSEGRARRLSASDVSAHVSVAREVRCCWVCLKPNYQKYSDSHECPWNFRYLHFNLPGQGIKKKPPGPIYYCPHFRFSSKFSTSVSCTPLNFLISFLFFFLFLSPTLHFLLLLRFLHHLLLYPSPCFFFLSSSFYFYFIIFSSFSASSPPPLSFPTPSPSSYSFRILPFLNLFVVFLLHLLFVLFPFLSSPCLRTSSPLTPSLSLLLLSILFIASSSFNLNICCR